jgi:hypothetical protein
MIKQDFLLKELDVLKELKGKTLNKIVYTDPIFASIVLEFEDYSIVINNNTHESNFADLENESISYFTVDKVSNTSNFNFLVGNDKVKEFSINERIESIEIINDTINDGIYEISFDEAIILKTNQHDYTISRDWFFMETMNINVDGDINDILEIDKVIEDYKGDDNNLVVNVSRRVNKLF